MYAAYADGKQSLRQLAHQYGLSVKTIRHYMEAYVVPPVQYPPTATVVLMDTLYFRRNDGCMVFHDAHRPRNLLWYDLPHETIAWYQHGLSALIAQGWTIQGLVCDGRRGIFQAFASLPVQMCHFHQLAILPHY
ncbi:MAG: hypothetical protein K9N46_11305 [Candidatus Marinimicrobia bacterium]|nr:hypothetical protein [Candidatus Neomarinimicrobiota bacterium]MCF7827630.1 hypothetical protein [Candidatus Neomarinimicrobiota bacterium]MCF7881315.1 hypothetical protein [Candidatus Neomarinimicrobiota bacterium]